MIHRIEVKSKVDDARSYVLAQRLIGDRYKITQADVSDIYFIDKLLSPKNLARICQMLINPVTQEVSLVVSELPQKFNWAIEIGYLPGVTDNVANTIKEMICDLLRVKFSKKENIYTAKSLYLSGKISKTQISTIAETLYNPLIQKITIKSAFQYKKDSGMGKNIPKVHLNLSQRVTTVDLSVTDEELVDLGKLGIKGTDGTRRGPLALDLDSLLTIRKYFSAQGRQPTDIELESIAQTWSEHCKHTIFNSSIDEVKKGLFKTYIEKATGKIRQKRGMRDFCVSVFKDNSGAIEFDENYLITHKVETHNSPSALEPFGGAITGIVGVNRDAIGFGLGAKPLVNTYGFCFALPCDNTPVYRDVRLSQKMLSPKRILEGVVAGVNSGGNCSGIPTPQGFVFFDKRYKGKPLVFVGTVGLIPKSVKGRKLYVKKARRGDYIVMVGGRVGLDGIHGATFSSEMLDTGSPVSAVQVGDPITQKKLSDCLVKEARDLGLYDSITDNGAGGLSCSVAEMAKESGGCLVDLERVPLKYAGLAPWQIWISESQERMTLAVPKNKWQALHTLFKKRGVEATVIGTFTNSNKCVVRYEGRKIADLNMDFLHDGMTARVLTTQAFKKEARIPQFPKVQNLTSYLVKLLARPNIASFEFISMQFDHEVQGTSVIKPLQGKGRVNGEATVVRPVLSSSKGIVLSQGLYPTYSEIDPYRMAACAIDSAIRNVVASGADPRKIALLDNFCWCSTYDSQRLWQLKQAAKACYDYATIYDTPFISGKDSMFNDFQGYDAKGTPVKISVLPTLVISAVGIISDVTKAVSMDVKFPGDLIYLLGETHDELGGSEYGSMLSDLHQKFDAGGDVPQVDAQKNKKLYQALHKAIENGIIASAHSVGKGGLAVTLAKTALAGDLGMDVSINNLPGTVTRDDLALFYESQGRVVVTVAPQFQTQFERLLQGNVVSLLGRVTREPIMRIRRKKVIVELTTSQALKAYKSTFAGF